MLRDLYEKQASTLGNASKTIDETSLGFGRNMMEMKEFVKAQRTYNVCSTAFLSYGTLDNLLHFTDILISFPSGPAHSLQSIA